MQTVSAPVSDYLYQRGAMFVIACGFLWSLAGIGVRMTEEVNGWQIVFLRSLFLAITMLVYMYIRNRGQIVRSVRNIGFLGVAAGIFMGSSFFGNIFALLYTSVANVTFILSSAPFLAALLGWVFLKESVRKRTWVAILFTTTGVLIMVNGNLTTEGLLGMGFAFMMASCYAAFSVVMRHNKHIDMIPAALVGALFSMAVAGYNIESFQLPLNDIIICGALGVIQMGIPLILFIKGSRYVPAAELTLLTMLEVILSPLWVWIFLAEDPGYWTLVGGGVITMGIIIQANGARRKPHTPPVY